MDRGAWKATVHGCREPAWGTPPMAKGEEGGSTYAKVRSSLRSTPGNSQASTPKTRVCLLSALCSHLHLWLYRGLSPTASLWKRVNLQLQLIKFLGVTRVFQPTNSSEGYSGHMWLFTASQSWEAWDVLNCLNTDSFEQLKDWLEIVLVRVFHLLGQCLLLSFHIPYLLCPWQCID